MWKNELFFPSLQRRHSYARKHDGSYYVYTHYRNEIREDCQLRCVYCDIHESECGGAESMQLDHFRPKDYFGELSNDPGNLVWSCPGCNRLKWNHWPAGKSQDCYIGEEGFIEPFLMNRLEFFVVNQDGILSALKAPAKYQIGLLLLNRQVRILIRSLRILKLKVAERLSARADRIEARVTRERNLSDEGKEDLLRIAEELRNDAATVLNLLFASEQGA